MANARTPLLIILLLSLPPGTAMAQDRQQRLAEALKRFPKADANGDGILSVEEAMAFWRNRRKNQSKAKSDPVGMTHADVKYGPYERNTLDLWLTHLTPDDPPIYTKYGKPDTPVTPTTPAGEWVHHSRLGIKLKEAADAMGTECHVQYPDGPEITAHASQEEFIIKKLTQ